MRDKNKKKIALLFPFRRTHRTHIGQIDYWPLLWLAMKVISHEWWICAIVHTKKLEMCNSLFPHRSCSTARHQKQRFTLNDDDPMIICQFVTIELRFCFVVAFFWVCLSQIKFPNLKQKSISNLYFIPKFLSLYNF